MEATGSAGKLAATRDHVIPKSKWTSAERIYGPRIVWACRQCNAIKADMLPDAWEAFMGSNPEWWRLPQYQFGANVKALARHPRHPWVLDHGTVREIEDAVKRISTPLPPSCGVVGDSI